jgi:hypothetical protein
MAGSARTCRLVTGLSRKAFAVGATPTLIFLATQDQSPLPAVPCIAKDALRTNETEQADSRRQSMGRPIEGYYAIKSVFRLAFRRFPYPPMSQTRPKRRLERSDGGRSIQSSCYPLQATLAKPLPGFTVPLLCFCRQHRLPRGYFAQCADFRWLDMVGAKPCAPWHGTRWHSAGPGTRHALDRMAEICDPDTACSGPAFACRCGALVVNAYCAFLLARFRDHSGSLTRAAFLSARNDTLANRRLSWLASQRVTRYQRGPT